MSEQIVATEVPQQSTAIIPTSAELVAAQTTPTPTMKFFTTDPQQLLAVQGQMQAWVKMKLAELRADVDELSHERELARINKWRMGPWTSRISKTEKRIEYYTKMEALLAEGYVMVPSMSMDLFAVRTEKASPNGSFTSHQPTAEKRPEELSPEPLGDGQYVSAQAEVCSNSYNRTNAAGKQEYSHTNYWASEFKDVDFPMDVAKPIIMERTAQAMALKAFDEIGVVRSANQRRGDPYVVGRIRDPRPNKPGVCFFIGWYVNVAEL